MDQKLEKLYGIFKGKLEEFALELHVTQDAIFIKDRNSMKYVDLEELIDKFEDMFYDDEEDADKVLDLGTFEGRTEMLMEESEMACFEAKVKLDKFWDYIYSVN